MVGAWGAGSCSRIRCSENCRALRPALLAAVRMVADRASWCDRRIARESTRPSSPNRRYSRCRWRLPSGWRRGASGPRRWSGTASAKSPRRTLPARSRCRRPWMSSITAAGCRSGHGGRAAWPRSGSLPGACGTTLKNSTGSSRLPRSMVRSSSASPARVRCSINSSPTSAASKRMYCVRSCASTTHSTASRWTRSPASSATAFAVCGRKAVDVAMFSSVTGEAVEGEGLDADYWCRNMRQPVLFKRAIDEAIDAGFDTFLELGAHPSLITPIRACLAGHNREGLALGTLHRERPDAESISSRPSRRLHVHGVPIDWGAIVPRSWTFVELPGHPWEKQVHWAESEESRAARLDGPVHPLLGYRLESTEPIWQSEIDANSPRYLQDHRIDGAVVVPGGRLCRADARGRTSSAGRRAPRGRGDFLSRGIVSQRRNVDADRNLARPSPRNRPGAQPAARRRNRLGLARNRARSTLAGSRISDRSVDAEDRAAAASGPRAFLPGSGQGRAHLRPGIPGRRNDLVCGGLRARQDRGAGIDHRCGQIHPSPRFARRLPAGHPWPARLRRRCAARRGRHDPVCHRSIAAVSRAVRHDICAPPRPRGQRDRDRHAYFDHR